MAQYQDEDKNADKRKADHISLAFEAQLSKDKLDDRFYYEPALSGLPTSSELIQKEFLGFTFAAPMWVSSMTGGTEKAGKINKVLAESCGAYGLGMGLGSCRALLTSDLYFEDFNVRRFMPGRPLFANLGIAQLSQLLESNQLHLADQLVTKLKADGLIIHINPLQEFLQPEGDHYSHSPVDLISKLCESVSFPILVKEVGQGFGPQSIRQLLQLPISALEFGASGGTNFALLELLRSEADRRDQFLPLAHVGHSADEMVGFVNEVIHASTCKEIIVSGGIGDFLDGYFHIKKSKANAIYAQASGFLKYALLGSKDLNQYIEHQIEGLKAAFAFLKIKE